MLLIHLSYETKKNESKLLVYTFSIAPSVYHWRIVSIKWFHVSHISCKPFDWWLIELKWHTKLDSRYAVMFSQVCLKAETFFLFELSSFGVRLHSFSCIVLICTHGVRCCFEHKSILNYELQLVRIDFVCRRARCVISCKLD